MKKSVDGRNKISHCVRIIAPIPKKSKAHVLAGPLSTGAALLVKSCDTIFQQILIVSPLNFLPNLYENRTIGKGSLI